MSIGDFWLSQGPSSVVRFQTKGGQTAIKCGEPVIQDTSGDVQYAQTPGANVTTGDTFVGIAASADSVGASGIDGEVFVWIPSAGTVYEGYAKAKASLATTQILTKVVIDFTTPKYTIDQSTTTNGFCQIISFDSLTGKVKFVIDMTEAVNA